VADPGRWIAARGGRSGDAYCERRQARFEVPYEQRERITDQFMRASTGGDMQTLLGLLAEDASLVGDGGGKVPTALRPGHRPDKVARGLLGGLRQVPPGRQLGIQEVNGGPAIVANVNDRPYGVVIPDGLRGGQSRQAGLVGPVGDRPQACLPIDAASDLCYTCLCGAMHALLAYAVARIACHAGREIPLGMASPTTWWLCRHKRLFLLAGKMTIAICPPKPRRK
jgi:hypothetical protein